VKRYAPALSSSSAGREAHPLRVRGGVVEDSVTLRPLGRAELAVPIALQADHALGEIGSASPTRKDRHAMPARYGMPDEMRADEAGATEDEEVERARAEGIRAPSSLRSGETPESAAAAPALSRRSRRAWP
jgi:hypothetical protein